METDHFPRVDKFLWHVRIYKTRAQATEACKKGHVIINDIKVKPSRIIKKGDSINIKKAPVVNTWIVKDFPKSRISNKLVIDYVDDITSPDELKKLETQESFFIKREKGSGRPTKKDRRTIDKLKSH